MSKPNNDYLKRLLGQNEINPATGLSDPESAQALAGYGNPKSRYRTDFGDLSQGRAYASDMKDAVVHRGDEEEYADTKAYSQQGGGYFSQGNWGFRINTLFQYLTKIPVYAAQGTFFLAGVIKDAAESGVINTYNTFAKEDIKRPGTMVSRAMDNGIQELLASAKPAIEERFPIFKSTAYNDGNWVAKAMTPEFWASDAVDAFAFAASSFIGGSAVAKGLNAGTNAAKLLRVGSKAQKAAQAAESLALPNVQRFVKGVDFTTNVLANTAMEAMFEAKDVRDAILADSNLSMKMTPEQLEQTAAEKARDVFYLNMLFLAPSNMFELGSLMGKGLKGGSRITRQADNLVDMLPDGSYTKLSPKWYEKPITKLPYTMATNAIGEGLYEENIQYLIQEVSKFNAHQGPGKGFGDTFGKLLSNVGAGELTNNVTDEQAQSILLGSAIGGGMQASHISPKINKLLGGDGGIIQQYRDKLKNRDKLYDDLTNTSKSASGIDVFERNAPEAYNFTKEEDVETGEVKYYMERGTGESETDTKRELSEKTWKALATNAGIDLDKGGVGEVSLPKLDNEGAPIFSVAKLEEAYKKTQRREELDTIYEALSANPEKNKYSLEVIRAAKIADLALAHFKAGLGAQLSDKIDSLVSMEKSNQDLLDVSAVDVTEVESTKAYVKALEEMYNSLEVGIVTDPAELKLQTARKEVLFDRGSRILTIGKLLDQNKKNVGELIRQLQTTNKELANQLQDEKWNSLKDISNSFDSNTFNYKNALDRNNWKSSSEQAMNQYTSFYEILNDTKVSKNNDEFIKLKTELEKGMELAQSRESLYEEWKKLSDLYKGGQYYADNYVGVSRKYDYITPSIDLKKTNLQTYLNWEKTQLPILRLRKKIHEANKDFLNKYIKDLLRNGESMVNVLDWAIANEVSLSDHHIKVILDELSDIRDQYKALSEEIKSANDEIDDGYAFGEMTPEREAELNDKIATANQMQSEIKQAVGAFFDYDLGELDTLLRDIKNRNTFENYSELDLKKYLAKSLTGFVESTLSNFNNNESYDDLTSLDEARETLESLIKLLKKRKDSADFADLIEELEKQLADVIAAQDVVVDRQLNKFRKEYVRVNAVAQGMIDIMPEEEIKELRVLLEANKAELEELEKNKEDRVRKPVGLNIFPILNFASGNKDVLASAQKLYKELVGNFIANNDRYNWINSEIAKREFPKAAQTNAVKAIKTLLQHYLSEQTAPMKGFEKADYGYDKGPDSSLNRYLSDGDIDAMILSLESGEKRPDHPISNTQLLEIAKLLKQLESLELTIAVAGSEVPVVSFIQQLDKELANNEALFKQDKRFTPATSILQALTVFQIYNNLRSALSKEKYGNWTYLKAPAGGGKALPLTTKVHTKEGLKQIGDLKVGDLIFGSNGETEVIGVFPQGKKQDVKITFSDGREIICCEDHLWSFYINRVGGCSPITVTTKYIDPTKAKYFLPKSTAVEYTKKNYFIDPYLMGVLLGDGGLSAGSVSFTNVDIELVEKVQEIVTSNGAKLTQNGITYRIVTDRGKSNPYLDEVRRLKINTKSIHKHIPYEYLQGSKEQRLELLRGLMDTDGTIDKRERSISFSSSSYRLISDVKKLALSLGLYVGRINPKETTHELHYRITIERGDDNLFFIPRKAIYYKVNQNPTYSYVTSVEYLDSESEMVCIKVDAEDELFLIEDYVLTHNTSVVVRYALKMLGIPINQVIAAGHNEHSAKGIQQSLGTANAYSTEQLTEALEKKTLPTDTQLIVIDEIGGLSQMEVNQIGMLIQTNYPNARVLVMGDPNQVTKSDAGRVAVEQAFGVASTQLDQIWNIREVTPLFSRYRSDNPSVTNLQDSFLFRKDQLTSAVGTANVDSSEITSTDKPLHGTFIDTTAGSLVPIILNAEAKNPDRSRAILVKNDEAKVAIKAQLDKSLPSNKIEILTYIEAQGRTIDEVYVNIPFDKGIFADVIDYNKAMYTATSRGKYFVYVGHITSASNKVDADLLNKAQSVKTQKEDNFAGIRSYLADALSVLGKVGIDVQEVPEVKFEEKPTESKEKIKNFEEFITGETTDKEKENILDERTDDETNDVRDDDVNSNPSSPEQQEDTESITPPENTDEHDEDHVTNEVKEQKPISPENTSQNTQSLIESSSNVFKSMKTTIDGVVKEVFKGINAFIKDNISLEVQLIKARGRGDSEDRYMFVRQEPDAFIVLGILTPEELSNYNTDNLELNQYTSTGTSNVIQIPQFKGGKTYQVDLQKSKGLKYQYQSGRNKFDFNSVVKKWKDSFFGKVRSIRGEILDTDYEFQIANEATLDQAKIVVPTKGNKGGNVVVDAGKPYILISGVESVRKSKGKSIGTVSSAVADQFIMLTPRLLNRNNQKHKSYIEPIQQYISIVKQFHGTLNKWLSTTIDRSKYQLGSVNFSELVTLLANVHAYFTIDDYSLGESTELSATDKTYGILYDLFPNKEFLQPNHPLLTQAAEIDIAIHGKWADRKTQRKNAKTKKVETKYRRNNKGQAQQMFDKLARANLWTTIPNENGGYRVAVLRDDRIENFVKNGQEDSAVKIVGRQLLGPTSQRDKSPKIKYRSDIVKHLKQAAKRSKLNSERTGAPVIDFGSMDKRIDSTGRQYFTVEELDFMFGDQAFDNNGQHNSKNGSGLRIPISRFKFNNKTARQLIDEGVDVADYFDDTFVRVEPNRIVVFDPGVAKTVIPQQIQEEQIQQVESQQPELDDFEAMDRLMENENLIGFDEDTAPVVTQVIAQNLEQERLDYVLNISKKTDKTTQYISQSVIKPATSLLTALSMVNSRQEFLDFYKENPIVFDVREFNPIVSRLRELGMDYIVPLLARTEALLYVTEKVRGNPYAYFVHQNSEVLTPIFNSSKVSGTYFTSLGTYVSKMNFEALSGNQLMVVTHETVHSIVFEIAKDKKAFKSLYNKLKDTKEFNQPLLGYGNKTISEFLTSPVYINRSEDIKINEALTIFIDAYLRGDIKFSETIIHIIKKWLHGLLSKIGLENLLGEIDLISPQMLAYSISKAIETRTQLNPIKVARENNDQVTAIIEADVNPIDTNQLMQLYDQLNPPALKQVLKRWITGRRARTEAESEAFKVVNGAMLSHVEGKEKDGLLKAGMIYIEENLGTEKATNILKHEVFHKIFRTFLSESERQSILTDTVKNYPYLDGSTETEIEHFAINLFVSYEYKRSLAGSIVRFFDRLLFRIGIFNRQTTELSTFFDRLFNGYYSGKGKYEYNGTLSADKLDKYFNNSLAMYEQAKNMLLQHAKNFYDFDRNKTQYPNRDNIPYTFDESLMRTRAYFKHRVTKEKEKVAATGQPLPPYYAVMNLLVENEQAWKELVRTLFPDTDVDKLFDVTDSDDVIENTDKDFSKDNELIDQQRKVLKNVKQQLSTIEYRNTQGEVKYVPFAQSYAILIKLMYGLDTNASPKDQKLFVANRLTKMGASPEARSLQNYLFKLIDKLYLEDEASKASKITFRGDNRLQVETETQFLDFKKQPNELQPQFVKRVLASVEEQGFTIQDFWDAYEVYRTRNTYAQIGSSIRSLRKVNNFLGQREKKGSTYIYKYFANRESGSTASLISVLSSGVTNNYNTKRKTIFTKTLWDYFKLISERDIDYAKEGIIKFYEELGFNPRIRLDELVKSGDIENQSIISMYNDIYYFLKRDSGGRSLEYVLANLEKENTLGLEEFVYDESYNFFRRLVDFVAIADPDFQTSSAMRGDGKKTYPFVNSSYALDTLTYLINGRTRGGWSPKFLETPFYKENIFVKGANKIIQLVDHDSLKYKGLESTAKLFKNETPFDWTARNFLYAFVGSLDVKSSSYFQFLDTPSNKPKAQAVEVGLLTLSRAKELLDGIRAQEGLRPDVTAKNYTPNKSYVASNEAIDQMVQDMLDDLINNGILSLTELGGVYSKVKDESRPSDEIKNQALKILQGIDKEVLEEAEKLSEDATQEEKDALQQKIDEASVDALEKIDEQNEQILRDYYKPAVELFVYNYYVNSHQLRQVTIGDPAFFKTGTEAYDIIKRMSIALAPGKQGVVSERLGFLPEKIKVAVGEDLVRYLPNPELLGDDVSYDATDAQGYVTPEFAARVKASYGYEEGLDVTMKPVHFEIDENGVPRALKFSTIELTDELCNKFPGLMKLRSEMRNSGTDIYTFASAVKVGAPVKLTKNEDTRYDVPSKIDPESQFEIRGENFRIQLNPSHDPVSHTANPSQLTYQGIINADNLSDISKILQYNAQLIDLGSRKIEREMSIKRNSTPDAKKTTKAVRRKAMQNWFDMPGFEGLWTLVNNDNIDLNMPILQKSLESLISSAFSGASVGFRFLGSKLVLQAEYGTNIVNREGKAFTEPLKWKDDQSWTEVYVPEAWAKQYGLKPGDSFSIKGNKIIAFRLPSTGLHSALVMQVKDFYPVPEGSNGNVVIAPHQIVFQHGSDSSCSHLVQ